MKKKIITLSTTIMLGMGGILTIPGINAHANIQTSINEAQQELSSLQAKKAEIEAQIAKMEQAIKDNNTKIEETNAQLGQAQAEIETLNTEIAAVQERISQRMGILKERAVSYQESGGQIGYMDVIFSATSFGEFIDRVGAVATIFEADSEIMKKLEEDQNTLKTKQETVEKKLTDLNSMKQELEGMQSEIAEQKSQNEALKNQLATDAAKSMAEIASLKEQQQQELSRAVTSFTKNTATNTNSGTAVSINTTNTNVGSGSIATVINAGNKYIGNSVYVFGGGRSASDIAAGRFDCSGFVAWAFSQAGVKVAASTDSLKNTGTRVSAANMQPGDMVFFNTYKTDGHVGIYLGGGKFIGSQSSTGVAVANMTSGYWANTFNGRVMRVIN
ncbi:coiled-coil domain-containing protein [Bacillus benzoevorans]|uniref:Peptidoglycan hydrolase CwlO-like protein n=1 Tax=Bacillus benzoevorans TaxID=1456 RepID=A0A7X0LVT2_9BACI|nr:C40 family peptidase [Bacillus benzoevorans]MBB6444614.1 peptidoglycan hydrolase CwlO-like protein [Bacillus benzoevorans]